MKREKSPTIYDLAKLAGSSASTVGSILNGTWHKRRISSKLAEKVLAIAKEEGYSPNMQARALRKEKSGFIGMIVPMYDNRYFSSIAEIFEQRAREMGFFPIVTCTRRDPKLELDAAKSMLDHRVEYIICTGATDPDGVADLCKSKGVPTINIDLPGSKSVSIISDNFSGAVNLTADILNRIKSNTKNRESNILFIGGRPNDHNTIERVRGFKNAHFQANLTLEDDYILTCGYAADHAEKSFSDFIKAKRRMPEGIFINSTISLEGITNWFIKNKHHDINNVALGCFDWDPFAAMIGNNSTMVKQDVPVMMDILFDLLNPMKKSNQHLKSYQVSTKLLKSSRNL
ncbi:LacI family DNA-binding transcriptional regulator [Marinomonas flavescens]|uniref:LacI family DNA-binding transcriptional regulator n=1 Tax=Marinomonas flavescens TaxID=2529379 RepID=UPI001054A5D1|nr:LacI family DNA-binding transcriptional regulator [Marinomonas flavescens]